MSIEELLPVHRARRPLEACTTEHRSSFLSSTIEVARKRHQCDRHLLRISTGGAASHTNRTYVLMQFTMFTTLPKKVCTRACECTDKRAVTKDPQNPDSSTRRLENSFVVSLASPPPGGYKIQCLKKQWPSTA